MDELNRQYTIYNLLIHLLKSHKTENKKKSEDFYLLIRERQGLMYFYLDYSQLFLPLCGVRD